MKTTFLILGPALLVGGFAAALTTAPVGFFVSVIVSVTLAYVVDYKAVLDASVSQSAEETDSNSV